MSPIAISTCSCSRRSTERCSGSARSPGGSSRVSPSSPRSSATPQAIEVIDDRLSYAEILLDVATSVKPRPMELAMARASTVRARVERIIAAAAMPVAVGWRKRLWIAAAIASGRDRVGRHDRLSHAGRRPPVAADTGEVPAQHYRPFVNFYAMGPCLGVRHLPRGRRAVRSAHRTAQTALDGWQRRHRVLRRLVRRDHVPARCGASLLRADAAHERPRRPRGSRRRDADGEPPIRASLDQYVGWYRIAPNRVLTVRRDGDRLCCGDRGRAASQVLAEGADAFSFRGDHLLIFLRDEQDKGLARAGSERGLRRPPRAARSMRRWPRRSRRTSRAASPKFRTGSGSRSRSPAARRRSCAGSRICAAARRTTIA